MEGRRKTKFDTTASLPSASSSASTLPHSLLRLLQCSGSLVARSLRIPSARREAEAKGSPTARRRAYSTLVTYSFGCARYRTKSRVWNDCTALPAWPQFGHGLGISLHHVLLYVCSSVRICPPKLPTWAQILIRYIANQHTSMATARR